MRVLIVHHEAEYFAGAEKVLGYFLDGLLASGQLVTMAAVRESRVTEVIPRGIEVCWVPSNARFSLLSFGRQVLALRHQYRVQPFEVVHGWAARDWELTALTATLIRRPAAGTLHDHPHARFLSKPRQRLMRASVAGLRQIVCVSEAVRQACLAAGYPAGKLTVVRNGLPSVATERAVRRSGPFRLGFLGQFSERKGLRGLFEIVEQFARTTVSGWELLLGGDAQDADGRKLVEEIKAVYSGRPWWAQVRWCGWVKRPIDFLSGLDLLICPSSEFDPFPTVLLEAGQAGIPVLASRVGGVPEIIQDGGTGWLFEAQAWRQAAALLERLVTSSDWVGQTGQQAKKRVEREFAISKMTEEYRKVYMNLANC
jgi:glycosyltransferase involved in cell wall biosynthesis